MSIQSALTIPSGMDLAGHYSSDFQDATSLITAITTKGMPHNPYNITAISKISVEVLANTVVSPAGTHHCIVKIAPIRENPVIHWQKKDIELKEGNLLVLLGSSQTLAHDIEQLNKERSLIGKVSSAWFTVWNKLSMRNVKEIGSFCKNKFKEMADRASMVETETVISWGIPIIGTVVGCLAIHCLKNLAISLKAERVSAY